MDGEKFGERRQPQRERRAANACGGGELKFGEDNLSGRRLPVMRLQRRDEARPVVARQRQRGVDKRLRRWRQAHLPVSVASGFPTGVVVTKRMGTATTPETKNASEDTIDIFGMRVLRELPPWAYEAFFGR